jgi:hypothetical protein
MRRHRIPVMLVALAAAGLLAAGCSSPPDAGSTTTVSYLWVVNSEGGSITGSGDTGLTLTLTGVRDYATQFADRPVRHAYVLSTTDFADRWEQWFSPVTPNAVLSFTEPASPMPASIVLEVTNPVYDKAARTLMFDAARLHREPDPHPDAVEAIALPNVPTPATFISGALFIDSAGDETPPGAAALESAATTSQAPTSESATASPDISGSPVPEQPLAAAATATYSIGDTGPGGGIVFYDAGSPQPWGRYLEAAPAGWNPRWDENGRWCGSFSSVRTSTMIGTGAANTRQMLLDCPSSRAAITVRDYAGGGLMDWFLPSADELTVLFAQRASVGGFSSNDYWSSSQIDEAHAWSMDFFDGRHTPDEADHALHIRPVRAF